MRSSWTVAAIALALAVGTAAADDAPEAIEPAPTGTALYFAELERMEIGRASCRERVSSKV